MEQNTHDSEAGFIRLDPPLEMNAQASASTVTRVLTFEGREHTITAVQATRMHANVIALRPQWYGQIDGFSCTAPTPTPHEAIEAAINEVRHLPLAEGLEAA